MKQRLINTIHGLIDENDLDEKTGTNENENEIIKWVEYWMAGELVHRSVHVHLKRNVVAEGIAQMLK